MSFSERFSYNPETDKLGKGGFGEVYRAEDLRLKKKVALKFFTGNHSNDKYSLEKEISRALELQHPNLLRYYYLDEITIPADLHGKQKTIPVAIMEYIQGGRIDDYVKWHPEHISKLLEDVLRGLAYLHEKKIIHRDISPSNILVDNTGAEPVAKIIDFGISKDISGEFSFSAQMVGKASYIAPEQYRPGIYAENGIIDTRVDLWSFGLVAYELLTGRRIANTLNLNTEFSGWVDDLQQEQVDVCTQEISEPWRAAVQTCLVKQVKYRARSATEVLDVLAGRIPPRPHKIHSESIETTFIIDEVTEKKPGQEVKKPDLGGKKIPGKDVVRKYAKPVAMGLGFAGLAALLVTIGLWVYSEKFRQPGAQIQYEPVEQITIGEQVWMKKNLNSAVFRDGSPIPEAKSAEDWKSAAEKQEPAWCYYKNNQANESRYGKLYNWYSVKDDRALCPAGWHMPDDNDWKKLEQFLGGADTAGGKIKSIELWEKPNTSANNSSGFSGVAAGSRNMEGNFANLGFQGCWWSAEESTKNSNDARYFYTGYESGKLSKTYFNKANGFSVRCIKD